MGVGGVEIIAGGVVPFMAFGASLLRHIIALKITTTLGNGAEFFAP